MIKSSIPIILAVALTAASGFAGAQNAYPSGSSNDASTPLGGGTGNSRADVKAQAGTGDSKSRTEGNTTVPHPMTMPGGVANSRADVKAQTGKGGDIKAQTQGDSTATQPAPGGMTNSRADVKSQINKSDPKLQTQGDSTATTDSSMGANASTAAERKARRAERKAKRDERANTTGSGTSMDGSAK